MAAHLGLRGTRITNRYQVRRDCFIKTLFSQCRDSRGHLISDCYAQTNRRAVDLQQMKTDRVY